MFNDPDLNSKLKYSHTINTELATWIEWNMNQSYNISKVGNYRFRPGTRNLPYSVIFPTYDENDIAGAYTGATDSDIIINAGFDDNDNPAFVTTKKKNMNLLYSLDDCFTQNRPRSGINKLLYLGNGTNVASSQYIDGLTSGISRSVNVSRRPRYYMASRYDDFKYWTSFRSDVVDNKTVEYGVSKIKPIATNRPRAYFIYDACPFVVYNEAVPTNKITLKVQTNIGEVDNGPFTMEGNRIIEDPLYGPANSTAPSNFTIQALDAENNWYDLASFTDNTFRSDGSPIIGPDGTVEIEYGLKVPSGYEQIFVFAGVVSSFSMLPEIAPNGYAWLLKESDDEQGFLYISDGGSWTTRVPEYSWSLLDGDITRNSNVVKKLANPEYFTADGRVVYREFEFIKGLRVVTYTMNKGGCTFDLIELSPRLVADISDMIVSSNITKTLADLGSYSMPLGNLIASVGSATMFDSELALNDNNVFDHETRTGSIVAGYTNTKMKFLFYDIVRKVNIDGFDYDFYIPVKTMYSERVPQSSGETPANLSVELRDLFYHLESKKAPELLLQNVSLSYAVTVLLDSIGFSNYTFRRVEGEKELIIPFFFIGTDLNVAEVLQQLAISSQSAMFFDEFNNLVVMSKQYMLPDADERDTDLVLYGQEELDGDSIALPNIISIASQEKKVFNGGTINYTTRLIQKSLGSISQAPYIDQYKTYVYKPVLLWEVESSPNTKQINEVVSNSGGYSLSAIPLKSYLSAEPPTYDSQNNVIVNNVLDFGEGAYWMTRFTGYFYANGEIIRYDACEYAVTGVGLVWISSNEEYQTYFSKMKFNGRIFPTGRVRIYTNVQNGVMVEHGRGQFGTPITEHLAGLDETSPWISNDNVRGMIQDARGYLFNTSPNLTYPTNRGIGAAGTTATFGGLNYGATDYARKSSRSSIIKNYLAKTDITENEATYFGSSLAGSVQSSALVFDGPQLPPELDPVDFVSYAYKPLEKPFRHFGTRIRVVGKIESGTNKSQTPIGFFDIYSADVSSNDPSKQITITGGSGGIGFNVNKETNIGYYFEIAALSESDVSSYKNNANSASYTIEKSPVVQAVDDVVTVTLTTPHDFELGDKVVVSGIVDDNRKTSLTAMNGEQTVIEISSDRKMFRYKIHQPATTIAISAAKKVGESVMFTANNTYKPGHIVTISGFSTSEYNLGTVVVQSATSTSFTVNKNINTLVASGTMGVSTYNKLSTIASSGGTVIKQLDENTLISDVFFYKVTSSASTADIIQKYKTPFSIRVSDGNDEARGRVTLTTLREHSFSVGEDVTITGVGAPFDGTHTILSVTPKSFDYLVTDTSSVPLTNLAPLGYAMSRNRVAVPEILWRGYLGVIVDSGTFTSTARMTQEEQTTAYDISAEYLDIGTSRKFFLYINNNQIATVVDPNPLPLYNNMCLFARGGSKIMFEHVYALTDALAENNARSLQTPISNVFSDELITESKALNKYAISGIVQNTYLSGISSETNPQYEMYYDEFGTIMREAAYFNIKYDRAYPTLYAKLASTLNRVRAYTVSGFLAGSYGAEFLIFNAIDKNINLDDTSGNYLRILGISFTQNTTHSLRVDDFFKKNSNFADTMYNGVTSDDYRKLYNDVLNSRSKYGANEFQIDAPYIQTHDAAEDMMDWIVRKTFKPRKTVGVNTFATQNIQLGDIVELNYNANGVNILGSGSRFVVYNIEYKKELAQTGMTVYLAEV